MPEPGRNALSTHVFVDSRNVDFLNPEAFRRLRNARRHYRLQLVSYVLAIASAGLLSFTYLIRFCGGI